MPKKPLNIPYHPRGTTRTSTDAITWNKLDPDDRDAMFAMTKGGKYFRKPRDTRDYRDWRPVTDAHIAWAARTKRFVKDEK